MNPVLILLAAAALAPWDKQERTSCDTSTVINAFYCASDDAVLIKKELVSNKTYFACTECGEHALEKGDCDTCELPLEVRVSGKDVCGHCLEKPQPRKVCEKKYYECPDCGSTAPKLGKCEPCDVRRERTVSRALIEYFCRGECGTRSPSSAACEDSDCVDFELLMDRRCRQSGTFPHATI